MTNKTKNAEDSLAQSISLLQEMIHDYGYNRSDEKRIETINKAKSFLSEVELLSSSSVDAENYRAVAFSTAHLSAEDLDFLSRESSVGNMVMERKTGFFIKLMTQEDNNEFATNEGDIASLSMGYSDELKNISRWALDQGYQLIEFDRDAPVFGLFPVHEETDGLSPT